MHGISNTKYLLKDILSFETFFHLTVDICFVLLDTDRELGLIDTD